MFEGLVEAITGKCRFHEKMAVCYDCEAFTDYRRCGIWKDMVLGEVVSKE